MSESKHTPGPWRIRHGKTGQKKIVGSAEVPIASMNTNWTGPTQSSNANLIAAAPNLLAACKRQIANIERWLETGVPASAEESKSIYDQMVAAVAKAEGRSL